MRLADLGAFSAAGAQARRLYAGAGVCVALAAAAVAVEAAIPGALSAMALSLAGAFLVLAAGAVAAAMLAQARRLALHLETVEATLSAEDRQADAPYFASMRGRAARRAGWQQAAASSLLAGVGVAAAALAWRQSTIWDGTPGRAAAAAALLLLGAFAMLVLERHLTATPETVLPEAPALAALARLPIAVCLLCGIGSLLLYAGLDAGGVAGRASAALCLVVAIEMLARAAATLFVPFPPLTDARLTATSAMAAALALRRPRSPASAIRDWLGIDFSRSWELAFVRAALAPVAALLLVFAWGLSGVDALRVDQRAIYERFGRPVAVFGPGLHLRLPWPLGRLHPVELGVMHDVPIVFSAPAAGAPRHVAPSIGAEEQPGPGADRLWNEVHPSEGAYMVASLSRGQQSFESIDVDMHVVYRVGLSDAAAKAAAFALEDPRKLVQTTTSRLVAHYFAGHTLPGLLGADRTTFSREIAAELQSELDASAAGIDVTAVVVEAIHPPPGAAAAYHAVQTADINAHTALAEQEGAVAGTRSAARRDAAALLNNAAVAAHSTMIAAQIGAVGFAADRSADARSPGSFQLERRFDKLQAGLAKRQILIIDDRLSDGSGPLLDLRPPGSSATFVPP